MKVTAALLLGAVVATVTGAVPASAANVRYRAAKSCFVDGREFRADIHTYGKPTQPNTWTEVQLWGYKIESAGGDTRNSDVIAALAYWNGNAWQHFQGIGWVENGIEDNAYHNGPFETGRPMEIGYRSDGKPVSVQIQVWFDGNSSKMCSVHLRPYDLEWIG
ncbi:hypothetical protein GCM10022225_40730 [Plantactinospora mayteni]|uniref:Secreted protein n=1 Tax=Plantactinospora mayteni TaxID=566021 RepID=A0ABQ4ETX7_9ACTN|nr:hypothetical protein [Plantactinospora mayteni]GIG98097.1 hypothetical protein Pma05_46700 [Plantactinospora mayteni]